MKTVGVFFGGQSVEHDISVITGVMTVNSIDKNKYNPLPVYVDKSGAWYTGKSLFDVDFYKSVDLKKLVRVGIFGGDNAIYQIKGKKIKKLFNLAIAVNCMHGGLGEDGSLVGALLNSKIPVASPKVLASAVCMDKRFTKIVMKGLGIKTVPYVYVEKESELSVVQEKLGFPVVVKPNKSGSSIGITVADDYNSLVRSFNFAKSYGEGVIIEPKLQDFIEINCAGYRTEKGVLVSECEQPVGRCEVLTFTDKYKDGERVFPANIPKKISDKIQRLTEKIYLELDVQGVIRIDYFLSGERVFVNEINTVPGSLAYYLFGDTLKSLTTMINESIAVGEKRFAVESSFNKEYNSGILSTFGAKGSKRL